MSHTASGWQEGPLLEWCYNVFSVCGCVDERERGGEREREREPQREPTGFNVPWHVLVGRGVLSADEVCRQVCTGALQEVDDLRVT